jgi:hypothetical protein
VSSPRRTNEAPKTCQNLVVRRHEHSFEMPHAAARIWAHPEYRPDLIDA